MIFHWGSTHDVWINIGRTLKQEFCESLDENLSTNKVWWWSVI